LKQAVDDFTLARDMEKRLILDQLTKDLAGYHDPHGPGPAASAPAGAYNPNLQYERSSQPLYPSGPSSAASQHAPVFQHQVPQQQMPQFQNQQNQQPQYQYQHPQAATGYPGARPVSPNPAANASAPPTSSSSTSGIWVCPLCTFSNQALHLQCSMCGSAKTA